jgi:chemotaxis protein MotA
MDIATILGFALAALAVFGGFMIEGGHLASIMQPTAALIVFGGTLAAVLVQFPLSDILRTAKDIISVFKPPNVDLVAVMQEMVRYAQRARKEGVVALESDADSVTDPFLRKALRLAVDGSDTKVIHEAMEVELDRTEREHDIAPKVLEAAGGYAPTIGILGAVLGLIHVMQNLSDPSKLGAGIAVAFVATVYGVFTANILYLPMASKIRLRMQMYQRRDELILTGVTAIVEGENPRLIEDKLKGYCGSSVPSAPTQESSAARKAA